jgi:hypothetical protein
VTGPTGTSPDQVPWDLSFLRVGSAATAIAAVVAAPVAGVLRGWGSAAAVVVGAAVVTFFFWISGVVIARAGRIDDTLTLPAALGTFLVKALFLFALLGSLPADGWLDRRVLGWSVIAGALLWSGVQMRWVWTRQVFYVPPPPPPADDASNTSRLAERPDPENPAPRG